MDHDYLQELRQHPTWQNTIRYRAGRLGARIRFDARQREGRRMAAKPQAAPVHWDRTRAVDRVPVAARDRSGYGNRAAAAHRGTGKTKGRTRRRNCAASSRWRQSLRSYRREGAPLFRRKTRARRLLSDFRQVEDNFRQLDRCMREKIATSAKSKGGLLDEIFWRAGQDTGI